jgi:ABC-type dipeptide/oligopeptide/nickel transport system permease component
MYVLFKRFGWTILTMWVVFTFSFFLMRFVPGGPFDSEKRIPEAIKRNMEKRYRLDQPLHVQYFDKLWQTMRLDFGESYKLQDYTVNRIIAEGFPVSASLGILALLIALTVGMTAGVVAAVRRNSLVDVSFMSTATLGIAVPNFVLASVGVVVFVFWFRLLPAGGWGTFQQLILPAVCLAAPFAAYIARLMRAGMLEVLSQDYVRTAFAKGLAPRTVIVRHALAGAMLPVVSYIGPATAGILTGSLVLERIFNIAGLGSHFIDAATQKDYTLAMGLVMVYTFLLCVMNFLVDLSYVIIDPRVKAE